MEVRVDQQQNQHVHPVLRGVLAAFANTQPLIAAATLDSDRDAELQAERLAEWRADDRESAEAEREGGAA
jgi:hypothetical protein